MAISIPPDCKRFRTAILPAAISFFWPVFLLGSSFGFFLDGFKHDGVDGAALAFAGICAAVFSFVGSWIGFLLYTYAFSAEGIYGISIWERRRFVRWQDISAARTFRFLNLRWLRIYAADGKVTWLPLFLSPDQEFRQVIRQFAPPACPILNYL